ncbi:MAG: rod shape-determining protein RodA [Elusimicrobiota bacterium]|jgi:rod shape determining protein RodA|nr:rod shape-determining protein RodA [Elusimicrobiota bacterium]
MAQQKSFIKEFLLNIDWGLVISMALLLAIGFASIASVTGAAGLSAKYLPVQGSAVIVGFFLMLILAGFNYQHYLELDKWVYILSLLLLGSVLIFGVTVRGTRGWFNFGVASFQAVELAKIMYILVISSFLTKTVKELKKPIFIVYAFLLLLGHLGLIMMQPDFSSTLSYFPVTIVLLYLAGVEWFYILCIVVFGAIATGIPLMMTFFSAKGITISSSIIVKILYASQTPLGWGYLIIALLLALFFIWFLCRKLRIRVSMLFPLILSVSIVAGCIGSIGVEKALKDYQRRRLIVFLDPTIDQRGSGYNIIQSKISVGSGKILGKGFRRGSQTRLGFLPEQHTDFIFSTVGEEGGWVFSQGVILIYFFFLWRALAIARNAKDSYGSFVAVGIATMFAFYAFINIGMVMGMMPVAGMPLLLLSYGGSSIVSSMCAVGILCSISIRRHTHHRQY